MKRQEEFFNFDCRSIQQKKLDTKTVNFYSEKNKKVFNITQSQYSQEEPLYQSIPHVIRKAYFSDKSYVRYTDNKDSHSHFQCQQTILTIHGCPGFYQDWIRLEKKMGNNFCRWINFFPPGFDDDSELRINYKATLEDLSQLIVKLLDRLGVGKIVFCGHSMGSLIMCYFSQIYKERLSGIVCIAGPCLYWYVGYLLFYRNLVLNISQEECDSVDDKVRSRVRDEVNQRNQCINFGEDVKFPLLKATEIFAFKKQMQSLPSGNGSQIFDMAQNLPNVLKFFAYGKEDRLIPNEASEGFISFYLKNSYKNF